MTPLPWLLVAVPREHLHFRRHVTILETLRNRPTSAWRCSLDSREFVLAETGVGGVMLAKSLDWLRTIYPPRHAFMAGFAGALSPELNVGDGVWATGSIDAAGNLRAANLPFKLPYRDGLHFSSDRLIASPAEKEQLAARHGALTVDMETTHLAAWCERHAVPWGSLRVVSDDVRTPVSMDVFELLEDGRVSAWKLIKGIARRPGLVRELLHLKRATDRATKTLGDGLLLAAKATTN